MTKKYNVIPINKDLAVVVDKEAEIQIGDRIKCLYGNSGNKFWYTFLETYPEVVHIEKHPNVPNLLITAEKGQYHANDFVKVIATIGKQIEDLPLVVLPEEENKLEGAVKGMILHTIHNHAKKNGWDVLVQQTLSFADNLYDELKIVLPDAAQQKGTYTEEDMQKAYDQGQSDQYHRDMLDNHRVVGFDALLQSLQPKRVPVAVELEVEIRNQGNYKGPHMHPTEKVLKVNPDNTIHPVKVYYV